MYHATCLVIKKYKYFLSICDCLQGPYFERGVANYDTFGGTTLLVDGAFVEEKNVQIHRAFCREKIQNKQT